MFANISLFDFGKVIFQRTKETNFILPSLRLHNARDDVRNKLEKRNVSKAERKKKKGEEKRADSRGNEYLENQTFSARAFVPLKVIRTVWPTTKWKQIYHKVAPRLICIQSEHEVSKYSQPLPSKLAAMKRSSKPLLKRKYFRDYDPSLSQW